MIIGRLEFLVCSVNACMILLCRFLSLRCLSYVCFVWCMSVKHFGVNYCSQEFTTKAIVPNKCICHSRHRGGHLPYCFPSNAWLW